MRVYILDDQFSKLNEIKTLLLSLAKSEGLTMQLKIFSNSFDLEEAVFEQGQYADVYFLDLDQHGVKLAGVNFAKRLREVDIDATISFISNFPTLMQQLFANHLGAYDFINKSQQGAALKASLKPTLSYHQRRQRKQKVNAKLSVTSNNQVFLIAPAEIISIETTPVAHQLKLVTTTRTIVFYDKLIDLAERLPDFIRCHRACLINRDYIEQIDYQMRTVTMTNQATLPVSRSMIKQLCELVTIEDGFAPV